MDWSIKHTEPITDSPLHEEDYAILHDTNDLHVEMACWVARRRVSREASGDLLKLLKEFFSDTDVYEQLPKTRDGLYSFISAVKDKFLPITSHTVWDSGSRQWTSFQYQSMLHQFELMLLDKDFAANLLYNYTYTSNVNISEPENLTKEFHINTLNDICISESMINTLIVPGKQHFNSFFIAIRSMDIHAMANGSKGSSLTMRSLRKYMWESMLSP